MAYTESDVVNWARLAGLLRQIEMCLEDDRSVADEHFDLSSETDFPDDPTQRDRCQLAIENYRYMGDLIAKVHELSDKLPADAEVRREAYVCATCVFQDLGLDYQQPLVDGFFQSGRYSSAIEIIDESFRLADSRCSPTVRRIAALCELEAHDTCRVLNGETLPQQQPRGTILAHAERQYSIGDSEPVTVTISEDTVLQGFLAAPCMNHKALIEIHQDGWRILKKLCKKYNGRFAPAITMPGKKGEGGYRIRIQRG